MALFWITQYIICVLEEIGEWKQQKVIYIYLTLVTRQIKNIFRRAKLILLI